MAQTIQEILNDLRASETDYIGKIAASRDRLKTRLTREEWRHARMQLAIEQNALEEIRGDMCVLEKYL